MIPNSNSTVWLLRYRLKSFRIYSYLLRQRAVYSTHVISFFVCFIKTGDCSASTMWDNYYWTILPQYQNLTEPKYTNADYIHHLNPNTKILAILRNPVDR